MALSISRIKGISVKHAKTLRARGLGNIDAYLAATRTPQQRQELAKELGVSLDMVLEHANRCDLARVKGIGRVYSNLLENAGVDTVKELALRVPENLQAKLVEVSAGKRFCDRAPTLAEVKDWVNQAKKLPKLLEY